MWMCEIEQSLATCDTTLRQVITKPALNYEPSRFKFGGSATPIVLFIIRHHSLKAKRKSKIMIGTTRLQSYGRAKRYHCLLILFKANISIFFTSGWANSGYESERRTIMIFFFISRPATANYLWAHGTMETVTQASGLSVIYNCFPWRNPSKQEVFKEYLCLGYNLFLCNY